MGRFDYSLSDEEWIKRINSGDRTAFEALFRKFVDRLCGFAWRYVRSKDEAEGIVQDLFLVLWEQHEDWTPRGSIESYLFSAVRNRALNLLKHERVRAESAAEVELDYAAPVDPDDALRQRELVCALRDAEEEMPERRRLIYFMVRQQGMSYIEVAKCSVS